MAPKYQGLVEGRHYWGDADLQGETIDTCIITSAFLS